VGAAELVAIALAAYLTVCVVVFCLYPPATRDEMLDGHARIMNVVTGELDDE
jgi:hypothetical protein